ncbi:MAG: arylesterase [Opitutaceae bacterium]|jgi:acyl-CoA thioesterase I|nr:arylesterase [Opitutaceae bacterium]
MDTRQKNCPLRDSPFPFVLRFSGTANETIHLIDQYCWCGGYTVSDIFIMTSLSKFEIFIKAAISVILIWFGALPSIGQEKTSPDEQTILIFGDSLTAGYGVDFDQAYPSILQSLLKADDLPFNVIPSGVSGETTAGGLRRIDWVMRLPINVFVLALGGNDGLRGIDLKDTERNLIRIAERVKAKNPEVHIVIAGMQMPPNLGERYASAFAALYPAVAEELDASLISFLLEGVGGDPALNQTDGIHPNREGHKLVAQHVYESLKPILK